jgi:hypothetical protein
MGNYRKKWWEENDLEEVDRPRFTTVEDRAFGRGRKYEKRRILRIVLWCIASLIIVAAVVNLLDGHIVIVSLR